MTGTIRCNKCKKKMDGVCECGNYKCFVSIYWHGEYLNFRKDDQGYVFTYDKAKDKLIEINHAIKKGEFNPEDCSDEKVAERKFENMIEKWLNQKEQEVNSNELSPETFRPYRSYSRNYYSFFNGYDVREIDFELLGHKQMSTTERYMHFHPDRLNKEASKLKYAVNWQSIESGNVASIEDYKDKK